MSEQTYTSTPAEFSSELLEIFDKHDPNPAQIGPPPKMFMNPAAYDAMVEKIKRENNLDTDTAKYSMSMASVYRSEVLPVDCPIKFLPGDFFDLPAMPPFFT